MSGQQGILSKGGASKDAHVSIDAPEQTKRTKEAPPTPSQVTAPKVDFVIKDEVELLRAGLMNKHGEHLKTQGK